MSTPPTVDGEEPRRLRVRRPDRRDQGRDRRGRGRDRSGPRRFPDGSLPQPGPVEPDAVRARDSARLLDRARSLGAKAASRRVFDPWVLNSPDRVPYFAELASLRDRVRRQLAAEDARADEDAALEASRVRAAAAAADERLIRAGVRRARLEERQAVAVGQLDRLARRADRWNAFRDRVRAGFDARRARAAALSTPTGPTGPDGPDETAGHGRPRWQALPDDQGRAADPDFGAGFGADSGSGAHALGARAAWEGATARPGMSRRGRAGLLGLLALVELPVYYVVFQQLHGTGDLAAVLSVSLTLAVSTVMILAPHIAGRILRRRSATGAIRLAAIPALALVGAWGYGAWTLGELRSKLVFREEQPLVVSPDVEAITPPSLAESLNLSPDSVSLMFIALLLLSGGIAFLLGLGDEHPYLGAYRDNAEQLRRLERETEEDAAGAERAKQAEAALPARLTARRAAQDARLDAVADLYEAAAHAYLDGVAGESGDPAVTEAAMRLSRQWPLLPR
ncbi:hypothetical protein GCM10010387_57890 [Streptomyces inusitatus]|uniref:Uncharacterized protein n=1 Tax=Streptomyces inusitatus TaxID=68221 RepID=A0A918V157_9ACTN|nr:hypothetical protein [Streptomyces inusitatus]GGZ56302.1 hypothetical protein GCM10010387_57890 [Streptomyces inusitatus]